MRQKGKRFEHNQKTTSSLVLPYEFYCDDRRQSKQLGEFRKDLSCQLTKSYAQKRGFHVNPQRHNSAAASHESKEGVKRRSNTPIYKHTFSGRKDLKVSKSRHKREHVADNLSETSKFLYYDDEKLNCKTKSSNESSNEKTKVETTHICHLVNEIESILKSNDFINQNIEEELIQKACQETKDKRWREYFSNVVLPSILEVGIKTLEVFDKFEQIQLNRKSNIIVQCFHSWKNMTIRFMRRDIVEKVDRMDVSYFKSKKRNIFNVLSAVSLGASSRKKILQRRKNGLAKARSNLTLILEAKNERKGIITNEMVQSELRRIFHTELFEWNRKRYLTRCFTSWTDVINETRSSKMKANNHLKSKLFKRWRNWTIDQIIIITGDCPRLRNNYVDVEAFRSRKLIKQSFESWKIKSRVYGQAKRMRRRNLSQFVSDYLVNWYRVTKYYRQIKINALNQWKNYQYYTLGRPFLCWKDVTITLKKVRQDRDRFICSYRRVKDRRYQWRIFRTWRQQARYGRVTALYSRQDLVQQLALQNRKIDCLESQIESYVK